jgi:hypothetical protein
MNTLDAFTLITLASILVTVITATVWNLTIAKDARRVEFWTVTTCFAAILCIFCSFVLVGVTT